jgi:uncharacterized protein YdaU (DUF1376 family)
VGKKSPSFQFYPSDFFGDPKVRLMSADAKAFYALLLLNIWEYDTQFSIPDDPELIARLLEIAPKRWLLLREEIVKFSSAVRVTRNARLLSPRLKAEKEKADKFRESQREKIKKRWNRGNTVVEPGLYLPTPTPTPTPKRGDTPLNPPSRGKPRPDKIKATRCFNGGGRAATCRRGLNPTCDYCLDHLGKGDA